MSVESETARTKNWACAMGLTSHECKPPTRKCRCFIALLFMTMKISAIPYFKEIIIKWLLTLVLENDSSAEAAHLVGPIPLQCYRNVFSLLHSGKQTKYPWHRRQRSVSARSFRTKQLILSVFCFVGLGIVPGTSHKLGQRSTTELQSRLAPLQQRLCVIEHFWCALSVAEYWSVWGLDNLTPWFLTFLTVTL